MTEPCFGVTTLSIGIQSRLELGCHKDFPYKGEPSGLVRALGIDDRRPFDDRFGGVARRVGVAGKGRWGDNRVLGRVSTRHQWHRTQPRTLHR